jgi:SAM-dependent methyltransferase
MGGGAATARELSDVVPLHEFSSVLDLGCGCGRVLPLVAATIPNATGCDVDGEAIAWASEHHPDIRWLQSRFEPPLPFGDSSFQLVYSISVFSHLDEPLGEKWLTEVARVLAPGGVGLLSVHGPHAFDQFRTGAVKTSWCAPDAFERGPLAPDELLFVPYTRSLWNRADLPGIGARYGLTFHGPRYFTDRSPPLEVLAVKPQAITNWQDLVVCQKPR